MKKIILTLFIFVATTQIISAQIPGYQGKRFSLGYNASSFFYLNGYATNRADGILLGAVESTKLSYKTELEVNYTLGRKVAGGLSYYFAKQKDNPKYVDIQNVGNNFIPLDNVMLCKLAIYEMHFQFYRSNFIAPVGLYYQLSLAVVKYSLASSDNKLTVYQDPLQLGYNTSNSYVLSGPPIPYTCTKIGYAIGKKNPIGHNFFLNTAIGINFFQGGDSQLIRNSSLVDITEKNYILENFNKNLRTHNLIEIKVGLGWLAF